MKKYFLSLLLLFTLRLLLAGTEGENERPFTQEEVAGLVRHTLTLRDGSINGVYYVDSLKELARSSSREMVNAELVRVLSSVFTDRGEIKKDMDFVQNYCVSRAIPAFGGIGDEENLPLLKKFINQKYDKEWASDAYYSAFAITNYREDFVEDFLKNTFMGSVKILGFHQRILEVEIPKARKENNIELQIHLLKMIRKGTQLRKVDEWILKLFSRHNLDISKIDGEIAVLENQVAASREKESSRTREASAPAFGISLWYLLLAIPFLAGIFFWQKKRSSGS